MTADDFERYKSASIRAYAADKVRGEDLTEQQAARVAEQSFRDLLPDGLNSRNQFVYSVVESSSESVIGTVWFGIRGEPPRQTAYLYDLVLAPVHRDMGYGRQTMHLLEGEVRKSE